MMTNFNDYRQCDQHRRKQDEIQTQMSIRAAKQAVRNRREWLRLAKVAITQGELDVAIARIQQAKLERI